MELRPILLATLISGGWLVVAPQSFAASDLMRSGYVHDSSGDVVRDGGSHCVRTSTWSAQSATRGCNADLLPPVAAASASTEPAASQNAEIAAIEPRSEPINIAEEARFGFDKAVLRVEDRQRLDTAVAQLKTYPDDATIRVTGYTDSVGSEEYNRDLSMRRARAAQEYLVANGVDPKRIVLSGMGESDPVASNDTAEGRAQNRRAEIEIKAE